MFNINTKIFMKKIKFSLLLLLMSTVFSFAAGTWQKLDLTKTGGGTINLNINKLELFEGKLYAATFDGIWVSPSANGGDWEAYGLQGEKVSHLCFGAMKLANVIITATDNATKKANKLYKYNGTTWVVTNLNPAGSSTFNGVNTSMAQIQDGGGNTVIIYPTWGNGIWRSADGGDNWTNYAQVATEELDPNTGVPLNAYKNVVSVRSFPGTTTLYGTDKVSAGMSYMIWSTDYGVTWNNKAVGGFFNPFSILSRKMNGVDVLYYGGENGNLAAVVRSEDAGANWDLSFTTGVPYWHNRKIIGNNNGPLYIMCSVNNVYVSNDNGDTFNELATGISATIPVTRVAPAETKLFLSDMVQSTTKLYVSAIMTDGIYVYDLTPTAVQTAVVQKSVCFPSIAKNELFVTATPGAKISITNLEGKVVKLSVAQSDKTAVDVSALSSSVYIVKIQTVDGQQIVDKFIKQ